DLIVAGTTGFPRDDERRTDAAGMRALLVSAQRRIAGLRPVLRVIGLSSRAADGVEACAIELEARLLTVLVGDDVGRAAGAAFLAFAVCRPPDEHAYFVRAAFP